MTEKHHHLVVRFSDTMFGMGDVAALHNKIVNEQGFVWFGKLGQTIAQKRVDMLNEQVAKNIPTYLYLVKGNRKKSTAYRADLLSISREEPEDKAFYPAYYAEKEIIQYMKAWMKVGKIEAIEMTEMAKLKALNSVFPISETLARSSSGYFLIHESKAIF
jgi:hypothetical protein